MHAYVCVYLYMCVCVYLCMGVYVCALGHVCVCLCIDTEFCYIVQADFNIIILLLYS